MLCNVSVKGLLHSYSLSVPAHPVQPELIGQTACTHAVFVLHLLTAQHDRGFSAQGRSLTLNASAKIRLKPINTYTVDVTHKV